jgi:excisionase family DNA binding protein
MDILSSNEAAKLLGISIQALHKLRRRRRIAAFKVGLGFGFRRDAVEGLLADPDYRKKTRRVVSLQELEQAGQLTLGSEMRE